MADEQTEDTQSKVSSQFQLRNLTPTIKSEPTLRDAEAAHTAGRSLASVPMPATLPSGHAELAKQLEHRSREWASMVRVLEQHRQHLEVAEREQEGSYEKLARVMLAVEETAKALKTAIDERKRGQGGGDIDDLFSLNSRALEELERVAATLATNLIWCRAAWDDYSRTLEGARRLRGAIGRDSTV